MKHNPESKPSSTCTRTDLVWSFVQGTTVAAEEKEFTDHLLEGCAECGAELVHARRVLADLDTAIVTRTLASGLGALPRPEIRERLMRAISSESKTSFGMHTANPDPLPLTATELPGVALAARSEAGWRATEVEGIEFKTLVEDPVRRTATALVRMAPGSAYPSHRHSSREECYVLAGDLSFGEQRMQEGDYQVAERGSVHPPQKTQAGCLLLIVSGMDDEPV